MGLQNPRLGKIQLNMGNKKKTCENNFPQELLLSADRIRSLYDIRERCHGGKYSSKLEALESKGYEVQQATFPMDIFIKG